MLHCPLTLALSPGEKPRDTPPGTAHTRRSQETKKRKTKTHNFFDSDGERVGSIFFSASRCGEFPSPDCVVKTLSLSLLSLSLSLSRGARAKSVLLPSSSLLRSHHHLPAVVELAPSSRGAFPSRFPSFEGDALKRGTEARGETLPPPFGGDDACLGRDVRCRPRRRRALGRLAHAQRRALEARPFSLWAAAAGGGKDRRQVKERKRANAVASSFEVFHRRCSTTTRRLLFQTPLSFQLRAPAAGSAVRTEARDFQSRGL